MSCLKNIYVFLGPIFWRLCLSSTIAGTAARSSATLALTTNCPFPPHPSQWECVTRAMLSCSSAAPPPPPKWTTGRPEACHTTVGTYFHTPQAQPRLQQQQQQQPPVGCYWHNTTTQLKSKMAHHWIQVFLKKKKKEKGEKVYILLSVVPEPRYPCEITFFGSWPQSRHSEGLNWTFQTWSTNTSLWSLQCIKSVWRLLC